MPAPGAVPEGAFGLPPCPGPCLGPGPGEVAADPEPGRHARRGPECQGWVAMGRDGRVLECDGEGKRGLVSHCIHPVGYFYL